MPAEIRVIMWINVAFAHEENLLPNPEALQGDWSFDPTLFIFLILGYFYYRGLSAYRGKAPLALGQRVLFFLGLVILTLASLPPFDSWADQLFSLHMVQHMLITLVGVPLMIFGAPFIVLVRGLPVWLRRRIFIPFMRIKKVRSFFHELNKPLFAIALFEGNFWFWHVPKFYNLALLNNGFHFIEHCFMALTSINLWQLFIDPFPLKNKISIPFRILILGLLITFDMALSAALTYSAKVWYAYDQIPLPSWWHWDRLQDQQLGGLIMWVPGSLVWILALIGTFIVWMKQIQDFEVQTSTKHRDFSVAH
jgi:putative membrane protein